MQSCGTISPWITGFSYRSLRREDRIRKANRASQLNDVDSARTRDIVRDGERARKETESSGVKRICGSRLESAPWREGHGSLNREEGQSMS